MKSTSVVSHISLVFKIVAGYNFLSPQSYSCSLNLIVLLFPLFEDVLLICAIKESGRCLCYLGWGSSVGHSKVWWGNSGGRVGWQWSHWKLYLSIPISQLPLQSSLVTEIALNWCGAFFFPANTYFNLFYPFLWPSELYNKSNIKLLQFVNWQKLQWYYYVTSKDIMYNRSLWILNWFSRCIEV